MNIMKKIINRKIILEMISYILSFPLLYLVFLICAKVELIPIINNLFIAISVFVLFSYQIYFIFKFTGLNINFYLKLFMTIVLIGLGLIAGYFVLLMSIFAIKGNVPFSYGGENYYILNEGWLDDEFVVYKKDFITMNKMTLKESEKTFVNLDKISNENARNRLDIYLDKDKELVNFKVPKEEKTQLKNLNREEILKEYGLEDVKEIPNSNFGLLEVDRAGARSRWFFVEIEDGKLKFISEITDTSPDISGKIEKDGSILLICKDINGNEKQYKSTNLGKTFEPIN